MSPQDERYDGAMRPHECWFCNHNCTAWDNICESCSAVILPTRVFGLNVRLKWDVTSPLIESQDKAFQVSQTMHCMKLNGGAVRMGQGLKKVLAVRNHQGLRKISWSLEPEDGKVKVATRKWAKLGEPEWTEVWRVLEGFEGSGDLIDAMRDENGMSRAS